MKAHTASLINAVLLIAMSLWGYLSSATPSRTALIPTAIGVVLLLLYNGVKKENKVLAHIAVVITLLALLGLGMPMKGAIGRGDNMAIMRIAIMMVSTVVAMIYFIKSFRDARKARENG